MNEMHKLVLPDWTKNLPDKTRITSKEISTFFGYKSPAHVSKIVARHKFPKCDDSCPALRFSPRSRGSKRPDNYWFLGTLRDYEIKQNKENK
ncbi:MAG: hypothetical protein ACJASL_000111 [Paraglaciecola sp.]|jgi:hypothetical protein